MTTTDAHEVASQSRQLPAGLAYLASDPAFVRDPYPRWRELRESDALHRTYENVWMVTRYADVQAVLRDPRMSCDQRLASGRPEQARLPFTSDFTSVASLLYSDPPDHTRLRRIAAKAFTPKAVEALRGRVTTVVGDVLREARERGEMDVMADLAVPLPVIVICELLGVPREDHDRFKEWSTAVSRMLDPLLDRRTLRQTALAAIGLMQYISGLVKERRERPRDDLMSALVAAETDGQKLSEQELFAMCMFLFVAGHETSTNLIGNGTLALLRNRDGYAALATNPGLAASATEELCRYDAPVQVTARIAREDVEIRGMVFLAGETVGCSLAAANRDPAAFDAPNRLDLPAGAGRRASHVGFGAGIHFCLGAPLARLEGEVTFSMLPQRFPGMELAVEPTYREHFVMRGLNELLVAL